MTVAARAAAACVAAAAVVAGCSSSGPGGSPGSSAAPAGSTVVTRPTCPPGSAADRWPAAAPTGLPVPGGLHVVSVQRKPNVVIRFTVPDDFHNTVRYLLAALPKAGFTLGTGDSEAEEADIPVSKGDVHASFKISDAGPCLTDGLLGLGVEPD